MTIEKSVDYMVHEFAAVHYYRNVDATPEHPMVNIYCGGTLKATFGKTPDLVPGFTHGDSYDKGLMWRVADVKAIVDAMGNTADCTVTALHPACATSGYLITNNDMTY